LTTPAPSAGPGFSPRLYGRSRVALPTGTEAAAFDRRAIDDLGVPGAVLMENAGRSAGELLMGLFPRGRIVIVAGGGNNGGDGVVLARSLAAWGRDVELLCTREGDEPDPLLHGWRPPSAPLDAGTVDLPGRLAGADIVVDALLGTGIQGAPRSREAALIRAMNDAGRPLVALDLPSGVNADDGTVAGEAVKATATIAFGAPKRGCLRHPGRRYAGRLLAIEIGFPPWSDRDASAFLLTPGWVHRSWEPRDPEAHKNRAGRLLLVAGSLRYGGAAILAGLGALRAGAGFLRLAAPPALRGVVQGRLPEAVFVDASDGTALQDALAESDAVAIGPGLGRDPETAARLATVLERVGGGPVLLDADALNLLAAGGFSGWSGNEGTLLTPHPGEAARLLGVDPSEVTADPEGAARHLAERHRSTVLLKGVPSMIASRAPEVPLLVAADGTSDLARAGMGDVLTGVAGALLARGHVPSTAGGLALCLTAAAASRVGAGEGLLPTDVAEAVPFVLPGSAPEAPDQGRNPGPPFLLLDLPRVR
jgi:ADP-dependent NAD(P)H-hydrate dehydratase / NAD(P)H-hydrate epimerase